MKGIFSVGGTLFFPLNYRKIKQYIPNQTWRCRSPGNEDELHPFLFYSKVYWIVHHDLTNCIILFPYSQDLVLLCFQVVLLFLIIFIILNFFILPYLPQKLHYSSLTKSALHAPRGNTGSNKCTLQAMRPHPHQCGFTSTIVDANSKPAS